MKGRSRDVLQALYTWVDGALDNDYTTYYVTIQHRFDPTSRLGELPIASIRIIPTMIYEDVYGRRLPALGSSAEYEFTIHVFQKYNTASGEDYNRDAQICARRIVDWLEDKNTDKSGMATYGIWRIRDMRARESDPMIRNVARIIVSGTVDVHRYDSP